MRQLQNRKGPKMLRRFLAELFVWACQGFFLGDVKRAIRVQRAPLQLRARQRVNRELAAYKAEQETILMNDWQQQEYDRVLELEKKVVELRAKGFSRARSGERRLALWLSMGNNEADKIRPRVRKAVPCLPVGIRRFEVSEVIRGLGG